MKATIFSILTSFIFFSTINAQVTIVCPSDVTVSAFELDSDYESYGDPNVNSMGAYTLDQSLTVVDNNCNGQIITINYTASEDGTLNTASCVQKISVTVVSLADIQWPAGSVELQTGTLADLDPELLTERPEPYEILNGTEGSSTIYITYEDIVLLAGNGFQIPIKVLRTWTALNWCTGGTSEFVQILNVLEPDGTQSGFANVLTEDSYTTVSAVVTTDQTGFTLDLSNCDLQNDLVEYLNCIAENNNLDPASNIILELVGNDDYLNGVSTLDLVMIQRHILGITPFTDNCDIIAADLTNDDRVTAVDILTMRKLILGIIPTLPSSSAWKFVNLGQVSSDPLAPLDELDFDFPVSLFPLESLDVKAIKTGDVNGSAAN